MLRRRRAHPADFRTSQFKGVDFEGGGHNPEAEVQGALRFLNQNKNEPFFLYFSTRLLHLPIDPKLLLEDYDRYGRITEGGLLEKASQDTGNVADQPENAVVLSEMKEKLARLLAPLDQPFGEFGTSESR